MSSSHCLYYLRVLATFWTNPQYQVTVTDADEDDEEDVGTIIVGLMQKGSRVQGRKNHTIGYEIYQVCVSLQ